MIDVPRLLDEAIAHQKAGRSGDAESLYRTILEHEPANFDALHLMGTLGDQIGVCDMSLDFYRRALEVRPGSAVVLNNMGNSLSRVGRYEEAREAFLTALTIAPGFAEAHNNLGLCLVAMGEHDEALRHFETALALKPDFAQVYHNAANLFGQTGDLDSAEAAARKAVELMPGYRAALFTLGEILRSRKQWPEARETLERAICLDCHFSEAWNALGLMLLETGEVELAVQAFQGALNENTQYAEARANLHRAVALRPKDEDLLADILKADHGGEVSLDLDLNHLSHPHAPVGGTAYTNWGLGVLTLSAMGLFWFLPILWAGGAFAGVFALYWRFGRPYITRKHRAFILDQVARDFTIWSRVWQFGGVRIAARDGEEEVVANSPDDDWRRVARVLRARAGGVPAGEVGAG